jgi:5-methyltetrahydrofolate corrinoid/iron sulfur protein methyltransferase
MLTIADNITTRNGKVRRAFWRHRRGIWRPQDEPVQIIADLVRQCTAAGADAIEINTQQYYDLPEVTEFAVNTVQEATDRQLCLSTHSPEALEAGLKACTQPPIVNYLSIDEQRLGKMLPLIASYQAEAVLLPAEAPELPDAEEMLKKAAILVGAANESGIPNERLFIDIGLFHITSDTGQRHLLEVMEFLRAMPEVFDPPVRSTCWIGNASAGAPKRLGRQINATLLAMLAGAGLSSAFVDALEKETMRAVRLIRVFRNEVIYSDGEIERGS